MSYAIGIDLGGTNIKAVTVSEGGDLLDQAEYPTEDDAAVAWAERIREHIERLQAERGSPAEWIGMAAPGLAAPDARCIAWMQGRLDAVQGLDWTEYLGAPRLVPVLNDAHAALLGEVWKGAAAGSRNAMLLTLGTGVGGAVLVDGRLLKGQIGRAGHLGHTCLDTDAPPDLVGTPGSLEDAIGDCMIATRTGGRFTSTQQLVAAHLDGDVEATATWLRSVYQLACGIASLVNVVDPEVVILGGGIARAGKALFEPLARFLDHIEWQPNGHRVRVVPAALGEFAGAIGAARYGMTCEAERPRRESAKEAKGRNRTD
jgi:glucokinase